MTDVGIANALLSVSDKRGLAELARVLTKSGVKLLSTGGTCQLLKGAGVDVREVSDYTGFPEIMGGRVKTLHPKIHGGLLGRRPTQTLSDEQAQPDKQAQGSGQVRNPDDRAVMAEHGITPIDLLVINLYPFAAAITKQPDDLNQAIENIDIGGPAMLRAAAKNYQAVTVLVDPDDYAPLLNEMAASNGSISLDTRYRLAVKAFEHVAHYDAAIAGYLSGRNSDGSLGDSAGTSDAGVSRAGVTNADVSGAGVSDVETGNAGTITAGASDAGVNGAEVGDDRVSNPEETYPVRLTLEFERIQIMRYGENPHQSAAFYREAGRFGSFQPSLAVKGANQSQGKAAPDHQEAGRAVASETQFSVSKAMQLQGKALSFNNVADADAAVDCVLGFDQPACVIVKHANPCGVAVADNVLAAYQAAFSTDPTSAFGGIIAINRGLDEQLAKTILDQQFVEVILCPEASAGAEQIIATKKNVRLLVATPGSYDNTSPGQASANQANTDHANSNQANTRLTATALQRKTAGKADVSLLDYKRVNGGLLVQQRDLALFNAEDLKVVTARQPNDDERRDLLFAWQVAKYVKSNAIVYAKGGMTIGIGAGQMSRVVSARIAGIKAADAGLEVAGSVMASDAFLPFRDGLDAAATEGITAVIQPGGSIRDQEVIDAANEAGMAMLFTGMRHFRH